MNDDERQVVTGRAQPIYDFGGFTVYCRSCGSQAVRGMVTARASAEVGIESISFSLTCVVCEEEFNFGGPTDADYMAALGPCGK